MTQNIVDALKAVIATRNWDFAGELADDANYVDCLRCFSAPRRLLYDAETPMMGMCLFCASCWYEHEKHKSKSRRKPLSECEVCNVIGMRRSMEEVLALQNLRAAERRYLAAHGWTRKGELWDPPPDQHFKYKSGYTHNHAVNSLKKRHGEGAQPRQQRNPKFHPDNYDD